MDVKFQGVGVSFPKQPYFFFTELSISYTFVNSMSSLGNLDVIKSASFDAHFLSFMPVLSITIARPFNRLITYSLISVPHRKSIYKSRTMAATISGYCSCVVSVNTFKQSVARYEAGTVPYVTVFNWYVCIGASKLARHRIHWKSRFVSVIKICLYMLTVSTDKT